MADWKEALEYLETRCDPDSKAPAAIRAHIEGLEANLRKLSPLNYEERCRLRDAEARVRELEAHAADRESEIETIKFERQKAEDAAGAAERDARLIACALAGAYAALDMESPPATAPLIERYIATTEQADED